MTTLTTRQEELAAKLLEVGAIKFGAFRLKLHETNPDAPLSPIYIDLRTVDNSRGGPLTPDIVQMIGQQLYGLAMMLQLRFARIAGVPNAGDPLAEAFASAPSSGSRIPILKLDKIVTTEGRKVEGGVQGYWNPHEMVLLVDDLITGAHSKLEAIQVLENQGLRVRDVLVVLDREQGGLQELERREITLHSIFKLSKLLAWYMEQRMISVEQYDNVITYLVQNS